MIPSQVGISEEQDNATGYKRGWQHGAMSRATRLVISAALTAALAFLSSACGGEPQQVSLAELAREQEEFSGKAVVTSGRIQRFEGPSDPYYVLQDQEQNRVALIPTRRAAPFEGDAVMVSGTFEVKEGLGRVIEIETIERSPRASGILPDAAESQSPV